MEQRDLLHLEECSARRVRVGDNRAYQAVRSARAPLLRGAGEGELGGEAPTHDDVGRQDQFAIRHLRPGRHDACRPRLHARPDADRPGLQWLVYPAAHAAEALHRQPPPRHPAVGHGDGELGYLRPFHLPYIRLVSRGTLHRSYLHGPQGRQDDGVEYLPGFAGMRVPWARRDGVCQGLPCVQAYPQRGEAVHM